MTHPSPPPADSTERPLASHREEAPGLLVYAMLAAALFLLHRGTKPTTEGEFRLGFAGHNAARYALAGRNYERNGFAATRFAPDLTPGEPTEGERHLYLHHPPLAPWLVGASFKLAGESEEAASRPFLWCSALATVLLFFVARHVAGGAAGGVAALLFAVVPMTGFYGAHVDPQGPPTTAAILACVLLFLRYRETGGGGRLTLLLAALAGSLLTDWPVAILACLMPLAGRLFPVGHRLRLWPAAGVAVAFFGLFLGWIVALGRSPTDELLRSVDSRSFQMLEVSREVLMAELAATGRAFVTLFTAPLLILAGLVVVPWLRAGVRRGAFGASLLLLGATGALHVLMFPGGALIHDYWTYLLLPPVVVAASAVVESVRRRTARSLGVGFSLVVACLPCGLVGYVGQRDLADLYAEKEAEAAALPHADLGRIVRQYVRPHERALSNLPYNPVRSDLLHYPIFSYYADRVVRGGIQTRDQLEAAQAEEGPFDRFVYVPLAAPPPVLEHLFAADPDHLDRENQLPPGRAIERVRVFVFDLRE